MILNEQRNSNVCHELAELVYDAKRFVQFNRAMIEMTPFKFTTRHFCKKYNSREIQTRRSLDCYGTHSYREWSPLMLTLEYDSITDIAAVLSPNGKLIASASAGGTVWLWDINRRITRGSCRPFTMGHSNSILTGWKACCFCIP